MTETRVLETYNKTSEKEAKKPIEFSYVLNDDGYWKPSALPPHFYGVVELVSSTRDFDVMRAYDKHDILADSLIYLGRWNDGFVSEG